ncbi:MAG: hypothetical protein ISS94_00520 [Candidatus Syntrophoarchaeum sp.]|nr:hypothetical protein [Candidatus Syntrophoarchaeum sp.]
MTMIGEEEERKKKKIVAKINKKKAELSMLATSLFAPVGKNPYFLNRGSNSIAIKNITELIANLDVFTEEEALWLASWIEYLGDKEIADRIGETPGEFKEIIAERYDELREFYR